MKKRELKPVIKWAGGKRQLIEQIVEKYPAELGTRLTKYAEPFVGSGAVLFDILSKYHLEEVYISDINAELINMYLMIREQVDSVVEMLKLFEIEFLSISTDERKVYYYKKRNRYNALISSGESKNGIESAALFIFLNRTCFNGLYRVNRKGLYNVPIGEYKKPIICDESNLRAVSQAIQNINIVCKDYRNSQCFIDDRTFVYFDPPYRPLSKTSAFTSYTIDRFDDNAQIELAEYVEKITDCGAYIAITNSDPKNVDIQDNFFDDLYSKQKIVRIYANRMINSNSTARGKISELFICNY